MPETPIVSPEYTELSEAEQETLTPWIEELEELLPDDTKKISLLLGMALGYCEKNKVDFNALLGAALAAEGMKQESKAAGDDKPETD